MTALRDGDLARLAPATAAVLDRFDEVLAGHLLREEADVVPLFARHFDVAQYEAVRKAALKHVGIGRQALFTVPFVAAGVTAELHDELLADGGLAMRVVYRLTRRPRARLVEAAFGPVASAA